jgi:hypothetical protein
MDTELRTYICRYESGGVIHSCRIDARSVEDAAARMHALPWGIGAGPIGHPRRYHPHLDRVITYAVASLNQIRHLMGGKQGAGEKSLPRKSAV